MKFIVYQILTKDSVTVFVNAIMYYKVRDPTSAVANVDDYSGSARLLAATTLRNVLGTLTLGDILCQREAIAREMKVITSNSISKFIIWLYYQDCTRRGHGALGGHGGEGGGEGRQGPRAAPESHGC